MKIGIFSPSSACSPQRYEKAKNEAQRLGHSLIQPLDPSANYGSKQYLFSSASASDRIAAFQSLVLNSEVSLIQAARGGYGAIEILSFLKEVKKDINIKVPVFLSGISDVTAVLLTLDGVANLIPVHGPGFLDAFHDYSINEHRKISAEKLIEIVENRWSGYLDLSLTDISGSGSSSMTGKVVGGNLAVLVSLIGSDYLPDFSGRILFLEETGEKPYRVHRALSQLKHSGLLDNLAGVLLGDFDKCVHEQNLGPTLEDVFNDIFSTVNYPVFKGFPGGHGSLNLPIPFGPVLEINTRSLKPSL